MALKILIVDDDPVWRQILHRTLKAENYEPIVAADAMTALTATQRSRPDLIILDLGLPAGGGQIFMQRLKSFPALQTIPVIVISGQDPAQGRAASMAAGAQAFIAKPASREQVLAAINNLLGK